MDLDELDVADYVIGGSAFVFLVAMFLPWYGFGGYTESGWSYFLTGMLPLLLAIAMVGQIVVSKMDIDLPDVPWGLVHLATGLVCMVLLMLRVLVAADRTGFGVDVNLDREFGVFVALLATIGLAIGGFLKFQEAGGTTSTGGSSGGTTPTQF